MFVSVKNNFNIKSISILLSVLGMAVLLLVAPCNVRNFIQVELGVSQTEVLNKSQSHLNTAQCSTKLDIDQVIHTSKVEIKLSPSLAVNSLSIEIPETLDFSGFNSIYQTSSEPLLYVPLYILYQSFQDYL